MDNCLCNLVTPINSIRDSVHLGTVGYQKDVIPRSSPMKHNTCIHCHKVLCWIEKTSLLFFFNL